MFRGWVSWEGYVQCRRPDIDVEVDAPGCEPWSDSLEGARYGRIDDTADFVAVLDCDPMASFRD